MKKQIFAVFVILIFVLTLGSSFVIAAPKDSLSLKDNFRGTVIDSSKWALSQGYIGSSITQNGVLLVKDMSLYPIYSAAVSKLTLTTGTVSVDFCIQSPSAFWAEVHVMLTDSLSNQIGSNVHAILLRKGNVQLIAGAWHTIDGTTADSICIFYQTFYQGGAGEEVLIAKNVNENTFYRLSLGKTTTALNIAVSAQDGTLIGSYTSNRQPLNTNLNVVLSAKSQSTGYALTGAFDNFKVTSKT